MDDKTADMRFTISANVARTLAAAVLKINHVYASRFRVDFPTLNEWDREVCDILAVGLRQTDEFVDELLRREVDRVAELAMVASPPMIVSRQAELPRENNARPARTEPIGAGMQQARCPECGEPLGFPEKHAEGCAFGHARLISMRNRDWSTRG